MLQVRRLTKTEESERIVINRSGRSTYLDQKSVLRTGATPVSCLRSAGKWLRTAGFERDMKVHIEVSPGRLVIEPFSSP